LAAELGKKSEFSDIIDKIKGKSAEAAVKEYAE